MPEENVTVTILVDDKDTKEGDVPNKELNVDVDSVPVRTHNAYVELEHAVNEDKSDSDALDGSELINLGDELELFLQCGDCIRFNTEHLLAIILKAADLPVGKSVYDENNQ